MTEDPQPIADLTAEDWFEVQSGNRGWEATFNHFDKIIPEDFADPLDIVGKWVNIDGKKYQVKGVERFALLRATKEHRYFHSFGILIGYPDDLPDRVRRRLDRGTGKAKRGEAS